jgi:tryptophan synthase beta chain
VTAKYLLDESQIPTGWLNLLPDLPGEPLPPLSPATGEPAGPDDLAAIFPMGLIEQEVSAEPEIEIPEEVRDVYRLWRPTPLFRAHRLERELDTPAHIYYKYEGVSPAGSHKPNTAVAQAYYNKQEGVRKLATETGAGQWGSALALACRLFGLECEVFMVGISYDQKPYRRAMIETWGGTVHRSPSELTDAGRSQASHPTGSLGIAISEAVEVAAGSAATNYSLGSVLNHVCLHQTVVGQESIAAFELAGEYPDVVVGCVGGGSNFAGLAYPFVRANIREGRRTRFLAAEPAACPTLTHGAYAYDFGDTVGMTPLMPMYTLGHDFVPPPMHAGGCATTATHPVSARWSKRGSSRRPRSRRRRPSRQRCASPPARGSSPVPSPRMRSRRRSTRPRRPSRRGRSG